MRNIKFRAEDFFIILVFLFVFVSLNEGKEGKTGVIENNLGEEGVKIDEVYGKLSLHFIKNNGQVAAEAKYYEQEQGHPTYITDEGPYFFTH